MSILNLHPWKITFKNPKPWRFGSNDFPDFDWVIFGFQPFIFRGVYRFSVVPSHRIKFEVIPSIWRNYHKLGIVEIPSVNRHEREDTTVQSMSWSSGTKSREDFTVKVPTLPISDSWSFHCNWPNGIIYFTQPRFFVWNTGKLSLPKFSLPFWIRFKKRSFFGTWHLPFDQFPLTPKNAKVHLLKRKCQVVIQLPWELSTAPGRGEAGTSSPKRWDGYGPRRSPIDYFQEISNRTHWTDP